MPRQSRFIAFGEQEEAALLNWRAQHDSGLRPRRSADGVPVAHRRTRHLCGEALTSLVVGIVRTIAAITLGALTLSVLYQFGLIDTPATDYHPSGFSRGGAR